MVLKFLNISKQLYCFDKFSTVWINYAFRNVIHVNIKEIIIFVYCLMSLDVCMFHSCVLWVWQSYQSFSFPFHDLQEFVITPFL